RKQEIVRWYSNAMAFEITPPQRFIRLDEIPGYDAWKQMASIIRQTCVIAEIASPRNPQYVETCDGEQVRTPVINMRMLGVDVDPVREDQAMRAALESEYAAPSSQSKPRSA